MDGMEELERRIEKAVDRIGSALDGLYSAADVSAMREELATARDTNAELEARVRSQNEKIGELESRIQELTVAGKGANDELEKLKASIDPLRTEADRADEAQELNRSMKSELDELHSVREADRAELDGILGELKKLLEAKASA